MTEAIMSRSASVLKTRGGSSSSLDDPYSGFDTSEFDHAYDLEVVRHGIDGINLTPVALQNVYNDREFVEAAVRSSYGRRPVSAKPQTGWFVEWLRLTGDRESVDG